MIYETLYPRKKRYLYAWQTTVVVLVCFVFAYVYGKFLEVGMAYLVLKTMTGRQCD